MYKDFDDFLHKSGYFMKSPHTTHELLEVGWKAAYSGAAYIRLRRLLVISLIVNILMIIALRYIL